jgi:hypothetical protein
MTIGERLIIRAMVPSLPLWSRARGPQCGSQFRGKHLRHLLATVRMSSPLEPRESTWSLLRHEDLRRDRDTTTRDVEDRNGTIWVSRSRMVQGEGPLCQVIGTERPCYGKEAGIPQDFDQADGGHFALDTAADEIAALVSGFLGSSR